MNPKTEELLERTFNFGVNCLKLIETFPKTKSYSIIAFQLAKASTSVGANYEEAQAAESSKDFVHKIGIVSKEARESNYWLRVVNEVLLLKLKTEIFQNLLNESFELKKIFISIKLTAQKNLKKEND
ncbi:MAG: four helix bundle protein [Ignavibacteriales bacterium]|nr:MAG: four helix bundle protein [Ignavibacteriales bacterium]